MLTLSFASQNIHIWSFKPSRPEKGEESNWACLYDTQTNGTSISQLYFRHNAAGLHGISKSDDQKLRVWDLTWEQKRVAEGRDDSDRPKRPSYVDVASTESTVGVCGTYAFALSAASEAIINLIPLDADDVSSPFNLTELALPQDSGMEQSVRPSRTGRQQRGELKSVVNVSGLEFDTTHALLNLSDGSVVHYSHDDAGHPLLLQCPPALTQTSIDADIQAASLGLPLLSNQKKMCLARVGSNGMVLLAVSSFDESTTRGAIMLRSLPVSANDAVISKPRRFWGFNGLKKKRRAIAKSYINRVMPSPAPEAKFTPVSGSVVSRNPTHKSVTPAEESVVKPRSKKSAASISTPGPKDTRIGLKKEAKPKIKSTAEEMDSQLESVVKQSSHGANFSPERPSTATKAVEKSDTAVTKKKQRLSDSSLGSDAKSKTTSVDKSLPESPKRRTKKKPSPAPSPDKRAKLAVPEESQHERSVATFLGMTVFERKAQPSLPESCYQQKDRPILLFEQIQQDTISTRMASAQAPSSLVSAKATKGNETFSKQCNERQKLAAKHRAEHEMLRRKVLHSIRYVLSTWDIELNSTRSHNSIVESAKRWFDEALVCHQETLVSIPLARLRFTFSCAKSL